MTSSVSPLGGSPSPRSAARLAAELVVIVAGVLIALGSEAWWAGRQEAESEREFLLLAQAELVDLEAELRTNLEAETEIRDGFREQLMRVQTGDPDESVLFSFTASSPQPRIGALRQLDGVRGPILASEPRLRADIGSLATSVDGGMALLASFFSDVVANLRTALEAIARIQLRTQAQITVADIRASPELSAAVSFHLIALENRIATMNRLVQLTENMRAALDEVLEREGIVPESSRAPEADSTGS